MTPLRLAVVVPFLNEADHLQTVLDGVAAQTRPPDELVLVDDGSTDGSSAIAHAFAAAHPYARVLRLLPRRAERDRMVRAHELRAFQSGVASLADGWDVAGKLDADVQLTPRALEELEGRFSSEPRLGIAGLRLEQMDHRGELVPHRCPEHHVEGATAFYRRACWEAVAPLPAILGWDTIDEVRARMHGWRTGNFYVSSGNALHLRRTGSQDGLLRGYRRAGQAAYAYGAHPAHVLAAAAARVTERPLGLCAAHYVIGWLGAATRRAPRAEPQARAFVRRENLRRIRGLVVAGGQG